MFVVSKISKIQPKFISSVKQEDDISTRTLPFASKANTRVFTGGS